MNTEEKNLRDINTPSTAPILNKDHGFFHSSTFVADPQNVFDFCREEANWNKILTDLPMGIDNFFNLQLIRADSKNADEFEIQWENAKGSKIQGTLALYLSRAPRNLGTTVTAVAHFDKFHAHDEEPSDLMNLFLRRMKALVETGVLATTKGQPCGREELKLH